MDVHWNDAVGTIGVVLILGSYLLFQTGRLDPTSVRYSVLNAIGAGLIAISLLVDFNLYALVVESAWFLISLVGIRRAATASRHSHA